MSSSFEKFAPKTTTKHRSDLFDTLAKTFSIGIQEFSKNIGRLFAPSTKSPKQQISIELEQREHLLAESRTNNG